MTVTGVQWVRDQRGRPTLELDLDGHPAHIRSGQKTALLRRGMVDGMVVLASERSAHLPNVHLHDDADAAYATDLVRCTDDPEVFALYQEMCEAIRRDAWQAGSRPSPVSAPSPARS
jgi:hypothetical protein